MFRLRSRPDFDATINAIQVAALVKDCVIPEQYHLNASLARSGYEVLPVTIIELCGK